MTYALPPEIICTILGKAGKTSTILNKQLNNPYYRNIVFKNMGGDNTLLFYRACFNNKEEFAKALYKPEYIDFNLLYRVCDKGHLDVLKWLMNEVSTKAGGTKVYPTSSQLYILFNVAVRRGYFDIINYLVTVCNVNPSFYNNDAITHAVENNKLDVIKYLRSLPQFELPDDSYSYHIICASNYGYVDILKFLTQLPEFDRTTSDLEVCLRVAVVHNRIEVVKYLCENFEVNVNINNGELHNICVIKGFDELREYLLKY